MNKNIVKIRSINQIFEALKINELDFIAVGDWNKEQISIAVDFFSKGCKQYVVAKNKSIEIEVKERGYSFNLMKFLPNSFIITKETALLCKYAATNEEVTKIVRTKGQLIVNLWQLQSL